MTRVLSNRRRAQPHPAKKAKIEEEKFRFKLSFETAVLIIRLGKQKAHGGWQSLVNDVFEMVNRPGNTHRCIYLSERQIGQIRKYSGNCSVTPIRKAFKQLKEELEAPLGTI